MEKKTVKELQEALDAVIAENTELKSALEASQKELSKAKAEKKASAKSGYPTAEVDGKVYAVKAKAIKIAGADEPLQLVDDDGQAVHENVRKALELKSGFVIETD